MKLNEDYVTYMLDGTQIMLATGESASAFNGLARANETAAFIIDCLKEETTVDEIVSKMIASFEGCTEEAAKRDCAMVIEKLKGIGALSTEG